MLSETRQLSLQHGQLAKVKPEGRLLVHSIEEGEEEEEEEEETCWNSPFVDWTNLTELAA